MADLFSEVEVTEEPKFPLPEVDPSWRSFFIREYAKPYLADLRSFIAAERKAGTVFPPSAQVFEAFKQTGLDKVRVLILGQDPYHGPGQAHGLSFSVLPGVRQPPSLANIFQELEEDLGIPRPATGFLLPWAKQGVMLLNAVLTVRAGVANSHKDRGWEEFTDAAIAAINAKADPVIFVLWGAYAQKKAKGIDTDKHRVIRSAHPSPLSAMNGFFGSKPFSRINDLLIERGETPIDWRIAPLSGSSG